MKVSIITIAFNNLEGLKSTYQSIRRQTFRDFEWIVVDGGSTDGTREFLEEHSQELAWWCCEPDKGVYNAQNKGTEHARGEYCIYMNSGDLFFADDVLEKIFERDIDADVIYGNWMLVFEDGTTTLGPAPEVSDMAYFFNENICHQAMLVKSELVLKRPYDESFDIYGDWDEWLALYVQGKRFERVDMIVCTFLLGGLSSGGTKALDEKREAEMDLLKERYYPKPWRQTMERVVPALKEYNAIKSWMGSEGTTSLSAAVGEREHLLRKRRKHNKLIRILIYICTMLILTNLALLVHVLL